MKLAGVIAAWFIPLSTLGWPSEAVAQTAQWRVFVHEGSGCAIERTGSAHDRVVLLWVPGSRVSVLYVSNPSAELTGPGHVTMTLEPSAETYSDIAIVRRDTADESRFATVGLDASFVRGFLTARSVIIRGDVALEAVLPGDAPEAVSNFRKCGRDVLRNWGIDPDVQETLQRLPTEIGGRQSWFRPSDYPRAELRSGVTGATIARLTIGTDGRVEACIAVESSGNTALDRRTCEVLRERGRYQPALDRNGVPVVAMQIMRVGWDF